MTFMVGVYLFLMAVGVAVLVTMPIWAGWWKPTRPKFLQSKGQRRGKRRLTR